jgi:hypothetical protein
MIRRAASQTARHRRPAARHASRGSASYLPQAINHFHFDLTRFPSFPGLYDCTCKSLRARRPTSRLTGRGLKHSGNDKKLAARAPVEPFVRRPACEQVLAPTSPLAYKCKHQLYPHDLDGFDFPLLWINHLQHELTSREEERPQSR